VTNHAVSNDNNCFGRVPDDNQFRNRLANTSGSIRLATQQRRFQWLKHYYFSRQYQPGPCARILQGSLCLGPSTRFARSNARNHRIPGDYNGLYSCTDLQFLPAFSLRSPRCHIEQVVASRLRETLTA
jgi:hypothetical protein